MKKQKTLTAQIEQILNAGFIFKEHRINGKDCITVFYDPLSRKLFDNEVWVCYHIYALPIVRDILRENDPVTRKPCLN